MNICPNCAADNPAGSRFCGNCGAPLSRICASCGAANDPGMRFCTQCGTPLEAEPEAAAPIAPAAERRLVSVLFADLVGFTAVSEARDPEETRELLSRYFDTCRRLIGLYGGTVEKFIGDAVMAVWGTPVATEDDAERAVRAALDLVAAVSALGDEVGAPGLSARAGVLTGEAAVNVGAEGQGMVAGDLVNTASRIQSVAEPGSVLVGDATRRATEQTIAYETAGDHELKGKQEPVSLWRAQRIVSARRGELRSDGLEAPFVGREREVRQLKELFHACSEERRAHLVSITGIAGIGKSRLAWEFYKYFDGIAETVYWHRGRCLAYGEGVTYWALADMVRMRCQIAEDDQPSVALEKLRATLSEHLLDEEERRFVEPALAQLLGAGEGEDAADRQELFAAWRLFFERLSDTYPAVLVFEDLQWADASLLDFIEYLLEWSRSHRLYVITLARPELLEKRGTWGAGQRSFTSIYLEPLGEPAMEELLAGLVPGMPEPLRAQILARAEGVPLYAVETVRMLLDRGLLAQEGATYSVVGEVEDLEVPETLHALIAARLDGLSEDERRLLQDAAVLGKSFSRGTLAALSGLDETHLAPLLASLVRKEVLSLQADARSPEHGNYGFLQDLVRRVAYETLSRHDRKSRHLAVADQLAASPGAEELAEVIASHLLAAFEAVPDADDAEELRGRAASALVAAGERAAGLAAVAEAQRYFEHAAELVDDEPARADLADRAGRMAWRANKPVEARALLDRAHAAYEQLGDVVRAALVDTRLADIDFIEGHPPQAVARLEPALAALEAAGTNSDIAVAAHQLGRFLYFSNEHERALPYLDRALSLAEEIDEPETLAEALNTKATLLHSQGRPREAKILLNGALALGREYELHSAVMRAHQNLGAFLWVAGDWRGAVANGDRALELARRVGDRQWEANFVAGPTGMLAMLGRWDEALSRAAEAETLATTDFVRGLLLHIAPIHLHRGDLDSYRRLLADSESSARSENVSWALAYALTKAALDAMEGRRDDALAAVDQALERREHVAGYEAMLRFEALEVVGDFGGEKKLRELLHIADELHAGQQGAFLRAQKARFRARLPEHDAEAELRESERLFTDSETPFYAAVVQLELAEHMLARGRAEEARPLLEEARGTFEELRAQPWLERVDGTAVTTKVLA